MQYQFEFLDDANTIVHMMHTERGALCPRSYLSLKEAGRLAP